MSVCQESYSQSFERDYVYYTELFFDNPVDTNAEHFRRNKVRGFVDSIFVMRDESPVFARTKTYKCDSLGNIKSLFIHLYDEQNGIFKEFVYDRMHRVVQVKNMKLNGGDTTILNYLRYEYDDKHNKPMKVHVNKPTVTNVREVNPVVSNPILYSLINSNTLKVYPYIYFTDVYVLYDYERSGDYSTTITVKYQEDTLFQHVDFTTRYGDLWRSEYTIWEKGVISGHKIFNRSMNTIETKSWLNGQISEHTLFEFEEINDFSDAGRIYHVFDLNKNKKPIFKIEYTVLDYRWDLNNNIDSSFIGFNELYDIKITTLPGKSIIRKKSKVYNSPSFNFWYKSISPTEYVSTEKLSEDTFCVLYTDLMTSVQVDGTTDKWQPAKIFIYVNKEGLIFRQKNVHNIINRTYL